MDKTLTREFIAWLRCHGFENLEAVEENLPELMDRFIDTWFDRDAIQARALARHGTARHGSEQT